MVFGASKPVACEGDVWGGRGDMATQGQSGEEGCRKRANEDSVFSGDITPRCDGVAVTRVHRGAVVRRRWHCLGDVGNGTKNYEVENTGSCGSGLL